MFTNITNQYSNFELEYFSMQEVNNFLNTRNIKPIVGEHTQEYKMPSIRGIEGGLSKRELVNNIIDVSIRILKITSPGSSIIRTINGYIYEDAHGSHKDTLDSNLKWHFCRCNYHKEV